MKTKITKEWLLEHGFSKGFGGYQIEIGRMAGINYLSVQLDLLDGKIGVTIGEGVYWYCGDAEYKYTHQIEDLYFALRHKKLIRNEDTRR